MSCWDSVALSFSICSRVSSACHEMCSPPIGRYSFSMMVFFVGGSEGGMSDVLRQQCGQKMGLQLFQLLACVSLVGLLYIFCVLRSCSVYMAVFVGGCIPHIMKDYCG